MRFVLSLRSSIASFKSRGRGAVYLRARSTSGIGQRRLGVRGIDSRPTSQPTHLPHAALSFNTIKMLLLARRAALSRPLASLARHSSTSSLLVEDRGPTRLITLNRPNQLNALTPADLDAFITAVEDAPAAVRSIAVTGAGRAFCAGMNTSAFEGLDTAAAKELITKVGRAVGALRLSPKVTAVLINGYCLGAAFEMALAADLRIALPNVKVGLPESKVGIPSVVDAALLRHHVGLSLAKEMLLLGEIYPVEKLGGFVNFYAEDNLVEKGEEVLAKVADLTPVVMAAQKELNEAWMNESHVAGIERSIDVFARVFADPSTHEAVEKYNARRKK
jgi:enoyl-CoA hydratase/carnithine racemase